MEPSLPALPSALHHTLLPSSSQEKSGAHTLLNLTSHCLAFLSLLICIDVHSLSLQGDEELAIDVMDGWSKLFWVKDGVLFSSAGGKRWLQEN